MQNWHSSSQAARSSGGLHCVRCNCPCPRTTRAQRGASEKHDIPKSAPKTAATEAAVAAHPRKRPRRQAADDGKPKSPTSRSAPRRPGHRSARTTSRWARRWPTASSPPRTAWARRRRRPLTARRAADEDGQRQHKAPSASQRCERHSQSTACIAGAWSADGHRRAPPRAARACPQGPP